MALSSHLQSLASPYWIEPKVTGGAIQISRATPTKNIFRSYLPTGQAIAVRLRFKLKGVFTRCVASYYILTTGFNPLKQISLK